MQKGNVFHGLDITDSSFVVTVLRVVGRKDQLQRAHKAKDGCRGAPCPADLKRSALHSSPQFAVAWWPEKHQE